jgi:hypothetical protein
MAYCPAEEESLLLSYRAAKDRILKMSIYDTTNSSKDIQEAIAKFFAFSGTAIADIDNL